MRAGTARRLAVAATAALTALAPATMLPGRAGATPPVGLVGFEDLARTQATSSAMIRVPGGSSAYVAHFTLSPGTGIGWRVLPGTAILSVLAGTLRGVRPNCTLIKATTGLSAVLPAGTYLFGNRGDVSVEFVGVFVNLHKGDPAPLAAPGPARPPVACKVAPQWNDKTASSLQTIPLARGRFASKAIGGDGSGRIRDAGGGQLYLRQGRDILVNTMTAYPGSSTGWISHYPALTFVERGVLTYYEDEDGRCVQRGRFRPGDAFGRGDGGTILAANEGVENVVATTVYINIPHRGAYIPYGNHLEAIDFLELPPPDCTKF